MAAWGVSRRRLVGISGRFRRAERHHYVDPWHVRLVDIRHIRRTGARQEPVAERREVKLQIARHHRSRVGRQRRIGRADVKIRHRRGRQRIGIRTRGNLLRRRLQMHAAHMPRPMVPVAHRGGLRRRARHGEGNDNKQVRRNRDSNHSWQTRHRRVRFSAARSALHIGVGFRHLGGESRRR